MEKERKFLFDVNIFDAPEKEEVAPDLPPPPPVFSEDELSAAKDMAFEQGRQQGQKEQIEAREQYVAITLDKIAQSFSKLFAAETLRENIFEKESLRLSTMVLDLLFPSLTQKLGAGETLSVIEKTLSSHRKTKEIIINVPVGLAGEVEALIARLRENEHDPVLWRVLENPALLQGDCTLEWSDGGAVRDSLQAAQAIRAHLEAMLGETVAPPGLRGHSEDVKTDVLSKELAESGATTHIARKDDHAGDE